MNELQCIKECEDNMREIMQNNIDKIERFLAHVPIKSSSIEIGTVATYLAFAVAKEFALRALECEGDDHE